MKDMFKRKLIRTSVAEVIEVTPQDNPEVFKRANIDVLYKNMLENQRKEKIKRNIILSTAALSLGVLTFLTY